jgi:hypothetical protein
VGTTIRRMSGTRREMADGGRILDGLSRRRILRRVRARGGSRERRRRWRRRRRRGRIRRRERDRLGGWTWRTRLLRRLRTSCRLATEARHAEHERKSSHRLPSRHSLEPIMVRRFHLAGLPVPKKAGGVSTIDFLPRPGDVIDVIISIERHQPGVVGKLASNGRPSRQNDGRTRSDHGLDSCCCICWTEAR